MQRRTKEDRKRRENRRGRGRWIPAAGALLSVCICAVSVFMANQVAAAPENPDLEALAEEMEAEMEMETDAEAMGDGRETKRRDTGNPLIVIDPGHGGIDEGCADGGVFEKEINLRIAQRVTEKLRKMGYEVNLLRETDVYLAKEKRVETANRLNADVYVSIHQNTFEDKSVNGIETWYDGTDEERDNKRLAELIHRETLKTTGAAAREIRGDAAFCVTGQTAMPACLIETGFLSNDGERGLLVSPEYQEQIADGIAAGLDLYFHPKLMYLTFDDGPSEETTDHILDILKERNIKATFFVIGEYVRRYPETARRIAEEGHTIGIHCDNHDYKALYESVDSYLEDFQRAYDTVLAVTGVKARLFRFPGGSINAYNGAVCRDIIAAMEQRGFVYFDWNASLEDAVPDAQPERFIENAAETAMGRERVVLLAHDRVPGTAQCLAGLIDAFPEYKMERLTPETEPIQFVRPWDMPY